MIIHDANTFHCCVCSEQGNKMKIKLVVIDLEKWQNQKLASWIVGNISHFAGWTKYGLVHTGVQIGHVIAHWFVRNNDMSNAKCHNNFFIVLTTTLFFIVFLE